MEGLRIMAVKYDECEVFREGIREQSGKNISEIHY